jgi:hypothetical protein
MGERSIGVHQQSVTRARPADRPSATYRRSINPVLLAESLRKGNLQMGVYRVLWRGVIGGVVVAGSAAAWMFLSWESLVGLGVLAAVLGPLVGAGIHWQTRGTAASLSSLLGVSALTVVGVIAVAGLLVLLDGVALLGVGLLVVGSPRALRILMARAPQTRSADVQSGVPIQPTPSPPRPGPPPPAVLCASLSDAELCRRWRASFGALQHTVSPDQRLHLIETRAALLDELAHRNPAGFNRWLNSGARAASDPARFVAGTHRNPPAPH